MRGNEAIHAAHCSVFRCVYGDPACPVVEVEPGVQRGGAKAALTVLRDKEPTQWFSEHGDVLPEIPLGAALPDGRTLDDLRREGPPDRGDEISTVRRQMLGDAIVDDAVSPVASAARSAFRLGWEEARRRLLPLTDPVDTALTTEFAVRNISSGWVYALPKVLPKFLAGKRGTRECAEWHLRQVAGPDPEDQTGFEIVERPVGPWKVSS